MRRNEFVLKGLIPGGFCTCGQWLPWINDINEHSVVCEVLKRERARRTKT